MNPFDFFDRVYVLNLNSRPERWKDVSEELKRVGIFERVTRIQGVSNPNPRMGCSLGHLACLKQARKDGAKTPLILEDDVRFFSGFEGALLNAIGSLPKDWELFYVGYNLDPSSSSSKAPEFWGAHLLRIYRCLTTHAYCVKRSSLRCLTKKFEAFLSKNEAPPDIVYAAMNRVSYGVYPMAAFQAEGFSDIELRMVKYTLRENVESVIRSRNVVRPWVKR